MKIKEDMGEKKIPRPVGVGATGVAKVGAVGIAVFAAVMGSSGIFVAKEIKVQNNQRSVPEKKKKKRSDKGKRHVPIASVSCSPPSSSLKSETLFFVTGSSLESLRISSDPSFKEKSVLSPQVVELGMDKGVTTNEEPSFTT